METFDGLELRVSTNEVSANDTGLLGNQRAADWTSEISVGSKHIFRCIWSYGIFGKYIILQSRTEGYLAIQEVELKHIIYPDSKQKNLNMFPSSKKRFSLTA